MTLTLLSEITLTGQVDSINVFFLFRYFSIADSRRKQKPSQTEAERSKMKEKGGGNWNNTRGFSTGTFWSKWAKTCWFEFPLAVQLCRTMLSWAELDFKQAAVMSCQLQPTCDQHLLLFKQATQLNSNHGCAGHRAKWCFQKSVLSSQCFESLQL